MSQRHAQAILQFVFLGLHPGNTYGAFSKTLNLRSFFGLICFDSRENQCAILRYCLQKAKQSDKQRETDLIQGLGTGDNKLFV
jgi:hypothetical protein